MDHVMDFMGGSVSYVGGVANVLVAAMIIIAVAGLLRLRRLRNS